MRPLLVSLLLLAGLTASAQQAHLFIKKGVRKVKSVPEGAYIKLQTSDGPREGYITFLNNDSIFINGLGFHINEVTRAELHPHKMFQKDEVLYTGLGIVLSTLALRLVSSKQDIRAFDISPATIGMASLLLQGILRRTKHGRASYRIGGRFHLQVFSLRPF